MCLWYKATVPKVWGYFRKVPEVRATKALGTVCTTKGQDDDITTVGSL